jgi:hypothetical protein
VSQGVFLCLSGMLVRERPIIMIRFLNVKIITKSTCKYMKKVFGGSFVEVDIEKRVKKGNTDLKFLNLNRCNTFLRRSI